MDNKLLFLKVCNDLINQYSVETGTFPFPETDSEGPVGLPLIQYRNQRVPPTRKLGVDEAMDELVNVLLAPGHS